MIDDIAVVRRLSSRPGYRLLTYRQVGLPFWDVPLRCRVLKKKHLDVVSEFVLKCIDADLKVSSTIASFLSLPISVVEDTMGELVLAGQLAPRPSKERASSLDYFLSPRGKSTLAELGETIPEEQTLPPISYDGLTHEYRIIEPSARWRPKDLQSEGILEIPPFPADPPSVDPSHTTILGSVVQPILAQRDLQLLSVLNVDGKRKKFFLKAIALVFESIDQPGERLSVQFAIDGRPSEPHDLAFARAEGARKLGIIQTLRDGEGREQMEAILGADLVSQRADEETVAALRRTTDLYRSQLEALQAKVDSADGDQKVVLEDEAVEVARRLDSAEEELVGFPVRIIEVHEHPPLLTEALTQAQDRLLIVSPWIRAAVVDDSFLTGFEKLLARGVKADIAYGIDDGRHEGQRDRETIAKLSSLSDRYPNFDLSRLGNTHAKILIVDSQFAVVTSFNWLSFRGDPDMPFRDERGTLITVASEIDRVYTQYQEQILKRTAIHEPGPSA